MAFEFLNRRFGRSRGEQKTVKFDTQPAGDQVAARVEGDPGATVKMEAPHAQESLRPYYDMAPGETVTIGEDDVLIHAMRGFYQVLVNPSCTEVAAECQTEVEAILYARRNYPGQRVLPL